ncbi:cache domain-containing protein [Echinicola sp. 20G]|uniref:cache domain-containing protein n=1 Tax=Echinicola sp. 20G TaxID=2781961 RepID=UPI001911227C|nr:cache domain-containing protein [Echinicola sp. 20G]
MKYSFFIVICVLLAFSFSCEEEPMRINQSEFIELDSIVSVMESDLAPLEDEIARLASYTESLFDHKAELVEKAEMDRYKLSKDGVIFREMSQEGESSVFVSSITPNRDSVYHQVYYTEELDSAFSRIQSSSPFVSQVYFNTRLQMCRIYPALDVLNVFDSEMDLTSFNFYYMADEVRNPEKKSKWVEDIYVDPAGRGWILSLIHPVYFNEELEGVIGLDITVNDIIQRFLSYKERKFLLIDGSGNIVAGTSAAIEVLNLPPLKNHTYVQTINADNFRKEDYNLFKSKSKEVRKMVAKFLLEKDNNYIVNDDYSSKQYQVLCRQMNLLNWYVLEIKD